MKSEKFHVNPLYKGRNQDFTKTSGLLKKQKNPAKQKTIAPLSTKVY